MTKALALSFVSLLVLASPSAFAADPSCQKVLDACKTAGYHEGGLKEGKGLWKQCVAPVMDGQTGNGLPSVDGASCKAKDPDFATSKGTK